MVGRTSAAADERHGFDDGCRDALVGALGHRHPHGDPHLASKRPFIRPAGANHEAVRASARRVETRTDDAGPADRGGLYTGHRDGERGGAGSRGRGGAADRDPVVRTDTEDQVVDELGRVGRRRRCSTSTAESRSRSRAQAGRHVAIGPSSVVVRRPRCRHLRTPSSAWSSVLVGRDRCSTFFAGLLVFDALYAVLLDLPSAWS